MVLDGDQLDRNAPDDLQNPRAIEASSSEGVQVSANSLRFVIVERRTLTRNEGRFMIENRQKLFLRHLLQSVGVLALFGSVGPALAQEQAVTGNEGVEEIVVTAQRRSESLQHVPIADTVVQGEAVRAFGVTSSDMIALVVPGLNFNQTSATATPYLRGVGQNSASIGTESPVAIYVDNVYQPAAQADMFDLSSIERIEVLKGPQGTLFGRNASAGVINVVTRDPSHDPSGEIRAGYANYDTRSGSVYATTGLSDTLAADVAVVARDQADGWGFAPTIGQDIYKGWSVTARSKWLWTPSDSTKVTFIGDYRRSSDTGTVATIVPGAIGVGGARNIGFYNSGVDAIPLANKKKIDESIQLEQQLGGVTLVDILAYQDFPSFLSVDSDTTSTPLLNFLLDGKEKTLTNEVHLISPQGGPVTWIVGGFFMRDTVNSRVREIGTIIPATFGSFLAIDGDLLTTSYAAFAQPTVKLTDSTRLTGGIRYTSDKREIEGLQYGSTALVISNTNDHRWNKPTFRAALDHDFSDAVMGYVSFNTGFKSGAFNVFAPKAPPVNPENVEAYEGGLKTELFDKHLRFNVAAFHYDYKDMQLRQIQNGVLLLSNAASSRINGADVDFEARPLHGLTIGGGFEILDAKYGNFPNSLVTVPRPAGGNTTTFGDVSGNQLIQASKFSSVLNVNYQTETSIGKFSVGGNYKHGSRIYWDPDNRLSMGPTDIVNGSLRWDDPKGHYNVSFWMNNISNQKYYSNATGTSLGGDIYAAAAPQTYGVTLGWNW